MSGHCMLPKKSIGEPEEGFRLSPIGANPIGGHIKAGKVGEKQIEGSEGLLFPVTRAFFQTGRSEDKWWWGGWPQDPTKRMEAVRNS